MNTASIPLFPLNTVLFPGGPLPLRLFEPRYIDMVSACLKQQSEFGVVAIEAGGEVGPSQIFDVGTLATISDWYQGSDGLLGITATGTRRFKLLSEHAQADGLRVGQIVELDDEPYLELPEKFAPLAPMLESILDDLGKLYVGIERKLDDATWVGYRFSEILPLTAESKQQCLTMTSAEQRLEIIAAVLSKVKQQ